MKPPSRKLQAEWAAKLKASGFVDLEHPDFQDHQLGGRHDPNGTPEEAAAREAYHRAAVDYGRRNRHRMTPLERDVWARHAEGESIREIATATRRGRHVVNDIVTETRAAMLGRRVSHGRKKLPPTGDMLPRVGRRTCPPAKVVAKMDDETLAALLPLFAAVLQRVSARTSKRSSTR